MKRMTWILVLLLSATPTCFANKPLTVQQLKDLLASLQQSRKDDNEVSDALMQYDLSEELTNSAAEGLSTLIPGPHAGEEIEILRGRSAFLAPPPTDLPATPAPDAAAQKAMLGQALNFATKSFSQYPHLSVIKSTIRYQDELRQASSVGIQSVNILNGPLQLVYKHNDPLDVDKGIVKAAAKDKTRWGANGQISEGAPETNLGALLQEASASDNYKWLRWQTVDGKQAAVFSFAVEKKKSLLDVNYCCFPKTEIQDTVMGPLTVGTIQSLTSWEPFKRIASYHGELFIDPDSGVIVRIIVNAEMKPSDFVFMEERRIDFEKIVVDGREYVLPHSSYIFSEAVPNGDSANGNCTNRHTLLSTVYHNYKLTERH
jgi:hypothetical protein